MPSTPSNPNSPVAPTLQGDPALSQTPPAPVPLPMPGAPIESRPLHLFVVADCSYSMHGAKIASLNNALVEAIDALRAVSGENPTASILVRAIGFSSAAWWHIPSPTPIEDLAWEPLTVRGSTDMAAAINLLTEAIDMDRMPTRGLPPVFVFITDGHPDSEQAYDEALERFLALPWAKKGVRVGIGIGDDVHTPTVERFIANPELPVLLARNSADLTHFIRWATVAVSQAASRPRSQGLSEAEGNVPLPPPPTPLPDTAADIW